VTIKNFLKSELKNIELKLEIKTNGREGVDFIIEDNQLYVQSINLDTTQRSIKIKKQDLGELKDNLFVALVLIIDKEPKVFYLIPSKDLLQADSNIFIENNVSLMPSLSNWEIKVSSNSIPELAKYALENMINKLKM
jgi:predicted ATP-grasp superfamily ATP-dependent carboligase